MNIKLEPVFYTFRLCDDEILDALMKQDYAYIYRDEHSGVVCVLTEHKNKTFERLTRIIEHYGHKDEFVIKNNCFYSKTLLLVDPKKYGFEEQPKMQELTKTRRITMGEIIKKLDKDNGLDK